MKTPEEIKKGLECKTRLRPGSTTVCDCQCYECDVYVPGYPNGELWCDALAYIQQLEDAIDKTTQLMQSATEVIKKNQEQLESTYSQVKKALCGKENVSWVEVLEAADQLKSRLAQTERERDALHYDLAYMPNACDVCVHGVQDDNDCGELFGHNNGCEFKWRGVCQENTKVEVNE